MSVDLAESERDTYVRLNEENAAELLSAHQPGGRRKPRGQRPPADGRRRAPKSIREGFGLIVSEALWKVTAVVAAPAGGIPAQIEDGVTGYLAGSVDEFADRVRELLENPDRARQLGATGALRVREQFLLNRLLRDHPAFLKWALAA